MRKTRGLFKKIGDIKETVHAWMSMIKGRNGKDLTEARKIRALFKKIGDIKETCHAKMGTVKDRNDKDPTEAEEIRTGGRTIQKRS